MGFLRAEATPSLPPRGAPAGGAAPEALLASRSCGGRRSGRGAAVPAPSAGGAPPLRERFTKCPRELAFLLGSSRQPCAEMALS